MDRQTSVTLPEHIYLRLQALSNATGQPAAFHIRAALEEHLSEWEDVRRAEQVLARVHGGQEATHSLDEVEKSLGLAD